MADEIAIKVENASKTFRLPHDKNNSIKSTIINFYRSKRTYEKQQALKDITFEVKKGEFFGVVGRNGSGKSTLLKMLAGIYSPSRGSVHINGKLTPFIELGVGFNPELTGRENVYLNGALLGFNRKEMSKMYKKIVEFAELERFMAQKLKNYSSGMQVRLAFSIAIRVNTPILLIDEVLAVGDAAFQQKCYEKFEELKDMKTTIILVTHDMSAVIRFCDRALMLEGGIIKAIGSPKEVSSAYLKQNYNQEESQVGYVDDKQPKIINATLNKQSLHTNENLKVCLHYKNNANKPIHLALQIFNEKGVDCFGTSTNNIDAEPINVDEGVGEFQIALGLTPGRYTITGVILDGKGKKVIHYQPAITSFIITNDEAISDGIAALNFSFRNMKK
jgi:ABC-type polysaccharide/polyol phosphate transport system ATPase subunit